MDIFWFIISWTFNYSSGESTVAQHKVAVAIMVADQEADIQS